MTPRQIARCLANYKKAKDEWQAEDFNDIDFLLDEFCYAMEYAEFRKKGDEARFRRIALGIDKPH